MRALLRSKIRLDNTIAGSDFRKGRGQEARIRIYFNDARGAWHETFGLASWLQLRPDAFAR
jgi:hypothetical protein